MGNLGLFIGAVWNSWLPINKNLWTSSNAVFTAGFALIVLGLFRGQMEGSGKVVSKFDELSDTADVQVVFGLFHLKLVQHF